MQSTEQTGQDKRSEDEGGSVAAIGVTYRAIALLLVVVGSDF